MAFSLVPYSRKSCIDSITIDKDRSATIRVDLKYYAFGRLVKRDYSICVCYHVDARTPRYTPGFPALKRKELNSVQQAVSEMRKHKFTDYTQLVARRLRKHMQRIREEQYG